MTTELNQFTSNGVFGAAAIQQMSGSIQRQTKKDIEQVQARTIIATMREEGRALLTNAALQNVAALTAFEGHLIQTAPLGEARYRALVDAFTLGAVQAIGRL